MGAKKIPPYELGLVLKGEDARRFHEYMESPESYETPEGRKLTEEALWIFRRKEMEKWRVSGEISISQCPACGEENAGCRYEKEKYDDEFVFTCPKCSLKWKIETQLMKRKKIIGRE